MLRPALLLMLAAVASSAVTAQDTLTDRDRAALDEYRAARRAWLEPGITTSLSDASTDVPFLDDFRPAAFYSLGEMPRIKGHGYLLVAPGCYEMDAPTFCLQAGSYGPGSGDGYALAPLRGKAAQLVHDVLWKWTECPEIRQNDVQLVVWALVGRKAVTELPPKAQEVAQTLLGPDGVVAANAAARGPEPEVPGIPDAGVTAARDSATQDAEAAFAAAQADLERCRRQMERIEKRGPNASPEELARALARLADAQVALQERFGPAAQRMAEASARLGQLMTAAGAAFEEVEREAVLRGDPEPLPGSRPIPRDRWSYHAGGFFTRCLPEHYSRSRIEVAVPAPIAIERDPQGRIALVVDRLGNRVTVTYDDASTPVAIPGDAGVTVSGLRDIAATPAGGEPAHAAGGWAFTGVPATGASASGAPERFPGLPQRHARAREHVVEVSRLVAALSGPDGRPPTTIPPAADLADAVDLAHLADAVRASVPAEQEAPELTVLRLVQQAWQAAVCRRVASLPGARSRHAAGGMASGPARPDGVRLATLALPQGLFAQATGAETDGLPILDPGWDGINPGNRARQRLGTAPMQPPDSEGKQVLRQAVEGCEFLQAALDVFSGLTDPVSWLMDKAGLGPSGMPGMLLSGMVQWMFDAGAAISQALGGDPPRADYNSLDVPPRPELPVLAPRKGLSAARARAGNAAAAGLRDWYTSLRAAQISLDRVGGALTAGDGAWARRQALAFVYHKRQAGERMVAACERYGALLDAMEDEGVEAEGITLAQLSTHLAALREKGFRPDSLEAARRLGLSDEEVEAARRRRLSFAPDDDLDDPLVLGRQVSEDLLDLGHRWLALPEVAAPAAPAP